MKFEESATTAIEGRGKNWRRKKSMSNYDGAGRNGHHGARSSIHYPRILSSGTRFWREHKKSGFDWTINDSASRDGSRHQEEFRVRNKLHPGLAKRIRTLCNLLDSNYTLITMYYQ